MYRCGSGSCHGHTTTDATGSLTILFDTPSKPNMVDHETTNADPHTHLHSSSSSSSCSSSPVDCTLSLGTASTRQTSHQKSPKRSNAGHACMPTIFRDLLSHPKKTPSSSRATGGGDGNNSFLARRCANCDATSTPLWRNGPQGPKSLCNACGIRFKKEERRAAATAPAAYSPSPAAPVVVETQSRHGMGYGSYSQDHPWAYAPTTVTRKSRHSISLSSSSRWWRSDDNDPVGEEAAALPYVSWCLNVPPQRAEFLHH